MRITGQLIEAASNAHGLTALKVRWTTFSPTAGQGDVERCRNYRPTIQLSEYSVPQEKPTGSLNATTISRGVPKYSKWTRSQRKSRLFSVATAQPTLRGGSLDTPRVSAKS